MQATVWTDDSELIDVVLSAGAAAGVEISVSARTVAGPVLVGVDRAGELAQSAWLRGRNVHVIGWDVAELSRCSMVLGAAVIVLPTGTRWLTSVLAGDSAHQQAAVIGVIGGAGGVGTSTVAAGLAQAAVKTGLNTVLVDLDDQGPGIDLLLGAEHSAGWRWPDLCHAAGEVGDIGPQLPHVDTLKVLAVSRSGQTPGSEQIDAVLRSLIRTNQALIIDLGRFDWAEVSGICDQLLVVASTKVASAAAARRRAALPGASGLVVTGAKSAGLHADEISVAIGLPLLAELPFDSRVAAGAEEGVSPFRSAKRRWRSATARLWQRIQELPQTSVVAGTHEVIRRA